jgi:FMN reductase
VRVTAVVGNPRVQSRTRAVAEYVARAVAAVGGAPDAEPTVVELAELGGDLFDWQSERVAAVVATVLESDLVVVASPTYKASYTGLLKAFLDRFGHDSLAGTVGVPLMVGGTPEHALAPEVHLRPVLVEIGLSQPTRALFVLESTVDQLDEVVGAWLDAGARDALAKALAGS